MSIRLASAVEDVPGAYMVVAPRAGDVLSRTLREAYRAPLMDIDPFGDLLRALDRIDTAPCRK